MRTPILSLMFVCCVYLLATRAAKLSAIKEKIKEFGETQQNGRRNVYKREFDETLYFIVQIGGSLFLLLWSMIDLAQGK